MDVSKLTDDELKQQEFIPFTEKAKILRKREITAKYKQIHTAIGHKLAAYAKAHNHGVVPRYLQKALVASEDNPILLLEEITQKFAVLFEVDPSLNVFQLLSRFGGENDDNCRDLQTLIYNLKFRAFPSNQLQINDHEHDMKEAKKIITKNSYRTINEYFDKYIFTLGMIQDEVAEAKPVVAKMQEIQANFWRCESLYYKALGTIAREEKLTGKVRIDDELKLALLRMREYFEAFEGGRIGIIVNQLLLEVKKYGSILATTLPIEIPTAVPMKKIIEVYNALTEQVMSSAYTFEFEAIDLKRQGLNIPPGFYKFKVNHTVQECENGIAIILKGLQTAFPPKDLTFEYMETAFHTILQQLYVRDHGDLTENIVNRLRQFDNQFWTCVYWILSASLEQLDLKFEELICIKVDHVKATNIARQRIKEEKEKRERGGAAAAGNHMDEPDEPDEAPASAEEPAK